MRQQRREFIIKNYNKVFSLGFILIITLVICLSFFFYIQLTRMAKMADQLHTHPYAVSNTTREIKFNLLSMQRYMTDAVLADSAQELNAAVELIDAHEAQVFAGFDLLSERFLGDKHAINEAFRLVVQWQPIREYVIELVRNNEHKEAIRLTKGEVSNYLNSLLVDVQFLNDVANKNARAFNQDVMIERQNALFISYLLSCLTVFVLIILALNILKRFADADKEQSDKKHLIDQNIMLAELDHDGLVLDVSNALCRFLDKNKSELIGEKSYFFDNSKRSGKVNNAILSVLKTNAEWRGEIEYINPEGKSCWAQSIITPCYDKHYRVSHFTNTLVSVTNQKLAIIDELTSLFNRRGFDAILSREYQNSQRDNSRLSLAILDIDYFKRFNDLYGHPQGDEALRRVSSVIRSIVDDTCFAFRIGGEEFAILFIGHNFETTKQKLLWIKEQVESLNIIHENNLVSDFLTISIGAFALLPESQIEEGRLYSMADKTLYQAKLQRNALVLKTEEAQTLEV